jgi:hypothetical protein
MKPRPDSVYVLGIRFPSLSLLNNYTRIPVRRLKDSADRTTVLSESEEYFNSDDEFDVTRLNIAKPGELFKVSLRLLCHLRI